MALSAAVVLLLLEVESEEDGDTGGSDVASGAFPTAVADTLLTPDTGFTAESSA